jgi:hypothetical protein
MAKSICCYQFDGSVSSEIIKEVFSLAVAATANIHGEEKVRRAIAKPVKGQTCSIDIQKIVGRDLNTFFADMATRTIGQDSYTVERVAPTGRKALVSRDLMERISAKIAGTFRFALWHKKPRGKKWHKHGEYQDIADAAEVMERKTKKGAGGNWKAIPADDNPDIEDEDDDD